MNSMTPERKMNLKRSLKEWLQSIAVALFTTFFVTTFIFSTAVVEGNSMAPTLKDQDRLIVNKFETLLKTEEYKRGDLIVFESPLENDQRLFIKRVIGLPGETINIMDGDLYVNEMKIEEPYLPEDAYTEPLIYGTDHLIAPNELFVVGDNRQPNKSNDSRSFGSISFDHVEGKIVLRIFPLDQIDSTFK